MKYMDISEFVGKTFTQIDGMVPGSDLVHFMSGSETYKMYHRQDCCESVDLDDVCGDPDDLIGTPIFEAYEEDSGDAKGKNKHDDSFHWTFYRLSTIKGTVTLKWYGTSNGYYSELVDIERES